MLLVPLWQIAVSRAEDPRHRWMGRRGGQWPGRQNRGLCGVADFARSCESGWLSLQSHMPRWPPFKEQLIILNARPDTGACHPWPSLPWLWGLLAERWQLLGEREAFDLRQC